MRFITKRALPRRTFLRGAGVALGLPLLDAMVPALSALADTPAAVASRLGFIYMPNGVAKNSSGIDYWTPSTEGRNFQMSQILAPLEPFRDRMLVVSGLDQNQAEAGNDGASGDHTRGTSSWLTGVYPKRTEGADVRNGISADQIAAPVLGKDTALPSLELAIDLNFLAGQCENSYSCAYLNTLAWTSPTTPLPTENNPRVVFERLFGDGGTAERRAAQARRNRSILDSVLDDFNRLQRQLGPGDRAVVERVGRCRARGRAADLGRRKAQQRRAPDARAAERCPRTLRRARQADVRAAVAGVPRRPHARRHVHARTRAELPHLSGDRRDRRSSRPLASPGSSRADREVREGRHLSGGAVGRGSSRSCSQRPRATARCWITRCSSTAPA